MHELKPCPFCGNKAKPRRYTSGILKRITVHYVECAVCRARTALELDIESAADIWNSKKEKAG